MTPLPTATAVAAPDLSDYYNHQEDRKQFISLGLSAARIRGAARRALAGQSLDDADLVELQAVRETLLRTADTVEFGLSAGSKGASGARLASLGLALDAIGYKTTPEAPQDVQQATDEAPEKLRQLADSLDALARKHDPAAAKDVADFFDILARLASQHGAAPGDRIVSA